MADRKSKAEREADEAEASASEIDPDRPKLRPEFSIENPKPGKKRVRYVGDGRTYVPGRPAVLGAIEAVSAAEAKSLIETGLYEEAPDDADPGIPENTTKADREGESGEPPQASEVAKA